MAAVHGKNTAILVGQYDISTYFNQVSIAKDVQAVSVDTFGSDDHAFIAGLGSGSISLGGLWDNTATSGSDAILDAALDGSQQVVTVSFPGASAIGQKATMLHARETSYPIRSSIDDAVRLNSGLTADGGVRGGVVLHHNNSESTGSNFASVDNSAATDYGSVGHLHVLSFSGTSATVKITDSTDDAVFADHITFASVTGATSERATVTGTVNRYARVELSGTFTEITFVVSFARNLQ